MTRLKSDINFSHFINQRVAEINRMYPIITFENGFFTIECPWRLRRGTSIIVGSVEVEVKDKSDKAYGIFEEALINNSIKEITHYQDISDITIAFDNDLYLDVFHDSSLYEGWQLSGDKGFLLVSVPGGSYAYWPMKDE